jgi:hypothetical protein
MECLRGAPNRFLALSPVNGCTDLTGAPWHLWGIPVPLFFAPLKLKGQPHRCSSDMKYDLAKQLNDAGFLKKSYVGAKFYRSVVTHRKGAIPAREVAIQVFEELTFDSPDFIYIPTLEDLIEACGRGFRTLDRDVSGGKIVWLCNNYFDENDEGSGDIIAGVSPAEAIARLWLMLRKK